jgi:hypothetical protein
MGKTPLNPQKKRKKLGEKPFGTIKKINKSISDIRQD